MFYPFIGGNAILQVEPSGDVTGVKDAAAIMFAVSQLPATGGVVNCAPGTWHIECGQVVINGSNIYLNMPGCYVLAVGAGDVIRMYDSTAYNMRSATEYGGGLLGSPIIDGQNTTGNSSAFHAGDILQLAVYVRAQFFTAGTTSKCVWLDNNYAFTEQCYGRIVATAGRTGVMIDNSANLSGQATGSFDRMSDLKIYIDTRGVGDGVVWNNGANCGDGAPGIKGNMSFSSIQVFYAIKVIGTNSGGQSGIFASYLDWGIELNGSGTFRPGTIFFDLPNNCFIFGATGIVDFANGSQTFGHTNNSGPNWQFGGFLDGDFDLSATNNSVAMTSLGIAADGFTIPTQFYYGYTLGLAANHIGAILSPGSEGQTITLINDSAFTLTFAASGSNVADGSADVIAAHTAREFIYESFSALWYRKG